jgi:hypothetical protein
VGVQTLAREEDVETVVLTADIYASEVMDALGLTGEEWHTALSGTFLMFLTDVARISG